MPRFEQVAEHPGEAVISEVLMAASQHRESQPAEGTTWEVSVQILRLKCLLSCKRLGVSLFYVNLTRDHLRL